MNSRNIESSEQPCNNETDEFGRLKVQWSSSSITGKQSDNGSKARTSILKNGDSNRRKSRFDIMSRDKIEETKKKTGKVVDFCHTIKDKTEEKVKIANTALKDKPKPKLFEKDSNSSAERFFKREISKLVHKSARKYLDSRQIASKDDYKHLCWKLSHKVIKKEHGNTKLSKSTPKKVQKYVDAYFQKHFLYKRHNS